MVCFALRHAVHSVLLVERFIQQRDAPVVWAHDGERIILPLH